jgi:hypothetical protein
LVTNHLLQIAIGNRAVESPVVKGKPVPSIELELCEPVGCDIRALALGEPVEEHGALSASDGDQRAKTTTPALAFARDPLLDQAAAKVSIDESFLGPGDGIAKHPFADPLAPPKAAKRLDHEDAHPTLPIGTTIVETTMIFKLVD